MIWIVVIESTECIKFDYLIRMPSYHFKAIDYKVFVFNIIKSENPIANPFAFKQYFALLIGKQTLVYSLLELKSFACL